MGIGLLGLAASCGDDAATAALVGQYRLVSANEEPLPAMLNVEGSCSNSLVDGMVQLSRRGRYVSTYQILRACPDGVTPVPEQGGGGHFRIAGDSVFFVGEAGEPAGAGHVRNDSLTIAGPLQTLLFVRQRD